jgi:phage terminase large subunit
MGAAEEIAGYVWAVRPGNKGGLKEEPLKENDHAMDALRYMVAARDLVGRTRVRWL